jgi:hypothetical protein
VPANDDDGAPHTNPDGTRLPGTHLHVYCKGYDDMGAQLFEPKRFPDTGDIGLAFEDFCAYCKILGLPLFQPGFV